MKIVFSREPQHQYRKSESPLKKKKKDRFKENDQSGQQI